MMKKFISIVLILALAVPAFSQKKRIPERVELTTIEINDGERVLEVFRTPKDGVNHYYLSVGHLGIGDEVVQFHIDPLSELFIPLGQNLTDALETLKELQELFKKPQGTMMEVPGCLAVLVPNDKIETVRVTYRKELLSNLLEFVVEREGYIRSTQVGKADLGSIVSSVKMYGKLHKKEL